MNTCQLALPSIDPDAKCDSISITPARWDGHQSRAQHDGEYTNQKQRTLFQCKQKSQKVSLHTQQPRELVFEKTEDDR